MKIRTPYAKYNPTLSRSDTKNKAHTPFLNTAQKHLVNLAISIGTLALSENMLVHGLLINVFTLLRLTMKHERVIRPKDSSLFSKYIPEIKIL